MKVKYSLVLLFASTMLPFPSAVYASPIDQIPSSFDPRKVEQALKTPRPNLLEHFSKTRSSRPTQAIPEGAEKIEFTLNEIKIEGAQAIDLGRLLAGWQYTSGNRITVADVYRLAHEITRIYATEGYELSFAIVPEQNIVDGVVRIQVVEAFVEKVVFTGDNVAENGLIAALGNKLLTAGKPLRTADLEHYLLLIKDIPGIEARATLSPSEGDIGGFVAQINIVRKAFEGNANYSNSMPASLGRHAIGSDLSVNGFLLDTDQIRLSSVKSIDSNSYWHLSAHYSVLLSSNGMRLNLASSTSKLLPVTDILRAIEHGVYAETGTLGLAYPVIRSRNRNLTIDGSVGLTNISSEFLSTSLVRDRSRFFNLALSYDFAGEDSSVSSIQVGIEQGIGALGARGNSRANGSEKYTAMTVEGQHERSLGRVGGGSLSLVFRGLGQASLVTPLLISSECAFGGRSFGRRFDSGEIAGDHCLLGTTELGWTVPFDAFGTSRVGTLRLHGFVDGGAIWQKGGLLAGELRRSAAASVGGGLSMLIGGQMEGLVEVAYAIKNPSGLTSADVERIKGMRINTIVRFRF